ncbi:MAG: amidohydrolase family protein, partial [Nanoarchaeota archaeon]|nr:amidohydrolase family protein [Nanoarchaeota archaeon]
LAIQKRFQLIFHTLGDASSAWVLKTLATKYKPKDIFDRRFRFEHLEVINPQTIKEMKEWGFIASVQPWHAVSDSLWLEKRLGQERLSQVSPIQSMINSGLRVCSGSDAPIEPHDPLMGLSAATLRRDPFSRSSLPWMIGQKVSVRDAVSMYTIEGAYAEFSDHVKGTLECGMLADFCVLSEDIFDMHPKYFIEVENLMTVIGGKVVYD